LAKSSMTCADALLRSFRYHEHPATQAEGVVRMLASLSNAHSRAISNTPVGLPSRATALLHHNAAYPTRSPLDDARAERRRLP